LTSPTIKDPKELLDFLFGDPAGRAPKPGTIPRGPEADFAAKLAASFERLRKIARATIRSSGLDPLQCQKIARERKTADAVFWAAQMLTELNRMQQYLTRVGPSELEEALGAVLNSLAFAGLYHAFTVTTEESSEGKSAPKSGPAGADKVASIARQMADQFRKRQAARDLLAGAILGAPRPSDAELKRQIGAEYGLGKSAAIHAIDYGLTILSRVA
jgi:hypothetical protein